MDKIPNDKTIELINDNIKLLKNNFEINESSKILIVYFLCESINNISKKYIMETNFVRRAKEYRQKVAHFNKNLTNFNEDIFELYNIIIEEIKKSEFCCIEQTILGYKEQSKDPITDKEILQFSNEFNLNHLKIFRISNIKQISSLKHEEKYILIDLDDKSDSFKNINDIIFNRFGDSAILKSIYQLEQNEKEVSLKW